MKTIAFVGMGRAGKDTACAYLAQITTLRNAGTTSKYLCQYMADKLGLPYDEAYARRHESDEMRLKWYHGGNELREKGPTTLVRMALEHGEITGGMRDGVEVRAARDEGVVDLIVWVENPRVPKDPTVMFGPEDCDLTVLNTGTLYEFHRRLYRFAAFAGLPMRLPTGPHYAWMEMGESVLDEARISREA